MKNLIDLKPNPTKMLILKIKVLTQNLPKKEVEKLYGCDFEFTVNDGMIVLLEVWHNPQGKHKYKNKYRQEFKVNAPYESVCEN